MGFDIQSSCSRVWNTRYIQNECFSISDFSEKYSGPMINDALQLCDAKNCHNSRRSRRIARQQASKLGDELEHPSISESQPLTHWPLCLNFGTTECSAEPLPLPPQPSPPRTGDPLRSTPVLSSGVSFVQPFTNTASVPYLAAPITKDASRMSKQGRAGHPEVMTTNSFSLGKQQT